MVHHPAALVLALLWSVSPLYTELTSHHAHQSEGLPLKKNFFVLQKFINMSIQLKFRVIQIKIRSFYLYNLIVG